MIKTVSTTLSVKEHGLEAILGAAYLMTDRAWVRLDGDRAKSLTVTLTPKPKTDLKTLKAALEAELAVQKVRWAIAKANAPVLEHVARQAVLFANGMAPAAPAPSSGPPGATGGGDALTAAQQAEIDRLIAEVEVEIKELKSKPAGADPDNVKATWEEMHGEKK